MPPHYITNSDTQSTSGAVAARGAPSVSSFSIKFSLLNLSNIFARRSRPDSTLSIGSSSTQSLSQTSSHLAPAFDVVVGVDGKLRNRGGVERTPAIFGDPNCTPHDGGIDFALLSCNCRREASTSFTELEGTDRRRADPIGEWGGESEGGDSGGESSVDVGDVSIADLGGEK